MLLLCVLLFFALPSVCRSFWARNRTHVTAATRAIAVKTSDPYPAGHQGTPRAVVLRPRVRWSNKRSREKMVQTHRKRQKRETTSPGDRKQRTDRASLDLEGFAVPISRSSAFFCFLILKSMKSLYPKSQPPLFLHFP